MAYSLTHIAQIINADSLSKSTSVISIKYLLFDSRQLQSPLATLFFAIKGERNDGHNYISNLYESGVRAFVLSDKSYVFEGEATFLIVNNPVKALQQLAAFHRQQFDIDVIGITGSNGKTIVKEWLFQLLHNEKKIVRSPKSYNSQIGVPLSVWKMDAGHELGIFEAGISTVGEMQNLAPVIDCQIGIFTNIGSAHDGGFENRTIKIAEKLKLFENCSTLIYNKDYPLIDEAVNSLSLQHRLDWSSKNKDVSIFVSDIIVKENSTQLQAVYQHQKHQVQIPFSDSASIENAIHCWVYLLFKGYSDDFIKQRLARLEAVAMRLELKEGINNAVIINDTYNSDLESLRIALHFMERQGNREKKCLILSDILQSGLASTSLYRQVAQIINHHNLDTFIGIGNEISVIRSFLNISIKTQFFNSTQSFLHQMKRSTFNNAAVLIKGARQFEFEKITNHLAKKVHRTVLEINLGSLIHNYQFYTQKLHTNTKILVMVKASAYGIGSIEVAKLLQNKSVDYLGVAYADEGVELRKAGIHCPILVLNSETAVFDKMFNFRLEPEIYSLFQLKSLLNLLDEGDNYPIHLKIDTGMNRLGLEEEHLDELIAILIQNSSKIQIQSIFSHLAASESEYHDDFTKQQINTFIRIYEQIATAIHYEPWRHILNSSGILRFPQYQFDMVRLGIGLYGVDSSELFQNQLQVVHCLKASISQIKSVRSNETIGYGRAGQVPNGGRIATVSIGYADGLLRLAGNGNFKLGVCGKLAPIVGNVCMDMCMIDISHIPEAKEGDEVEIFGHQIAVKTLADSMQTIPYEIFTNISGRVKRVYFLE